MRKLIVFVAAGALAVTGLVAPALATFKGSNGRLLYQGIVGEHEQLFTVKPDGSDVRQLTDFPDSDATNAAWSPDWTKIAFVRRWGTNKGRIYTMNADGSGAARARPPPAWHAGVVSRRQAPPGPEEAALDDRHAERRRAPLRRHARLGGQPLRPRGRKACRDSGDVRPHRRQGGDPRRRGRRRSA